MATDDLTVKASIDDELSRPLEKIRENVEDVGDEATKTSRKASAASRGWDTLGRAASKAGQLGKRAAQAFAVGAAAAGYAAVRLGKAAITQASDLNESLNAVNVTYGKQARAVQKLGRQAAKSLGLSNTEFNGLAVRFSAFAKTVGGGGRGTVKALERLTGRASDFASVMNLEVAESAELFQSGLAGETEPLRKYGIDLSAAKVEAYAYAKGIAKTGEELTEAQKVQARYGTLMEQTAKTHGDFANTSGELANQQRILGARWDNAQAKLGRGLLPVAQQVVRFLNREGIPAFLRFSDWFNDKGIPRIKEFYEEARPIVEDALPGIRDGLESAWTFGKKSARAIGDLAEAFGKMPGWAQTFLISGSLAGLTAKKLGITKLLGGGAKTAAAIASKAKPLPVWVVNNGTGVGGTPAGGAAGKAKGGLFGKVAKGALGLGAIGTSLAVPFLLSNRGLDKAAENKRPSTTVGGGSPFGGVAMNRPTDGITDPAKIDRIVSGFQAATAAGTAVNDLIASLPRKVSTRVAIENGAKTKAEALDLARTYDLNRGEVKALLKTSGIPVAKRELEEFETKKEQAAAPATAKVSADTTSANATLDSLRARLNAFASTVIPFAGGVGGRPAPREHGGPVKAGTPYVVGERRPELFVPDRPGTIVPRVPHAGTSTGGGITIAPGAITVTVTNPTATVDVADAVRQGIEEWVRDREERA